MGRRLVVLSVLATALTGAVACAPPGPGNQAPYAFFSTNPSTGSAPLSVTFNAGASSDPDGTIVSYNWDFGDFTTGSGQVALHTFPAGTFTVTLTVTDNGGATASSTTVVSSVGTPAAPTGLTLTGSGCCDTYGTFAWNPVPGVAEYQIDMDGYFLGGCVTDHSAFIPAPASSGMVQAVGLCLGSQYDVTIRARVGANWGPYSPSIHITL